MDEDAKLAGFQAYYPEAKIWREGGRPLVFIPQLGFPSGREVLVMDALLCPWSHSGGYPTRLFLDRQVPGKGQNWNAFVIRGRTWWACSWNSVPEHLPWSEILASHLRPFA